MSDTIADFPKLEFPTKRVTVNIVASYEVTSEVHASTLKNKIDAARHILVAAGGEIRLEYNTQ